ncbi:hypothetical protein HUJ04_001363 [Dendroctonus ponderosae]|nr:hypothetical protein HUJ04_001363 [Dendroctonus ponderosae]
MLDLFTIFSKGGIVLWCFQSTSHILTSSVNALIQNVILQERPTNTYEDNGLLLQYKLDNEFDLVFVAAYQKILQLSYVDKFLNDIQLEFRDKYKNELADKRYFQGLDFSQTFKSVLQRSEAWGKSQSKLPKQMRTFDESDKSKKTVSSMIERKGEEKPTKKDKKKEVNFASENAVQASPALDQPQNGTIDDTLAANRAKFAQKMAQKKKGDIKKSPKSPKAQEKASKKPRVWDLGGTSKDLESLERTVDRPEDAKSHFTPDTEMVGQMQGSIKDLEVESSDEEFEEDENEYVIEQPESKKPAKGGMFSIFKGLVGSKNLTLADVNPALEKLKDHLIAKNVASDIAIKLCDSVAAKLEGKVLGYGKDAAGIAMEAIKFARDTKVDVVLIDTAGRMQDNEPLMRALTKLIKVNEPDLVLFVGEALVGNEAVDQLVKFNQALADYSANTNPHLIDGIVLTKFDTIDDKVGAAISMTYITGQPIVFVGTGQTYTDLKALNVKAVVHSLMK